jgi:hypothetical protein
MFKRTRFARPGEETPCRSALRHARQRLGAAPLRRLFDTVVRPLATPQTPGAFYKGPRLMGVDGVAYDVPDREENERAFGRPSGGERGDGAFPQIRKVSLVELGTHVEVAVVFKTIRAGEQAAISALLKHLPPDALLLWDRGFFSYERWKALVSRGIRALVRLKNNMVLQPIRRRGQIATVPGRPSPGLATPCANSVAARKSIWPIGRPIRPFPAFGQAKPSPSMRIQQFLAAYSLSSTIPHHDSTPQPSILHLDVNNSSGKLIIYADVQNVTQR